MRSAEEMGCWAVVLICWLAVCFASSLRRRGTTKDESRSYAAKEIYAIMP